MNRVLAIDPGTTQSGWCVLGDDGKPDSFGIAANHVIISDVMPQFSFDAVRGEEKPRVAIEMIEPRGMGVGADTFRTVWWAGRFAEAWSDRLRGDLPMEVFRKDVKLFLCGQTRAKDGNVRQALITRFGGEGDKAAAIGKKASPGPLYGMSSHMWAALAVGVYAQHMLSLVPAKCEAVAKISEELMQNTNPIFGLQQ